MLRITYFQNMEQSVMDLTKKRVAALLEVLKDPVALSEITTTEQVFDRLVQISNPNDFEGEIRNQAVKRMRELFHMSIWYQFSKPNITDFGGKYATELDQWQILQSTEGEDDVSKQARNKGMLMRSHMIRIVVKFIQDQLRKPVETLQK